MLSRASLICARRRRLPPPPQPSSSLLQSCRIASAASLDEGDAGESDGGHRRRARRFFSYSASAPLSSAPQSMARCNSVAATHHHHHPSLFWQHQQTHQNHSRQQTRTFAGRKDRASTAFESRKPTRKQLKKYHKRRREQEYEQTKHSAPNSKSGPRRREEKERTRQLIEIAEEEEVLKGQLAAYYDKVSELQSKLESSPKFQSLLEEGKLSPDEVRAAARDAAKRAADKSDTPHPPLPSWWQERMTYDWGDALVDDLMGNSADLTSSPSPSPVYMGGEYGRLRRKVERAIRGRREEEKLMRLEGSDGSAGRIGSGLPDDDAETSSSSSLPDVPRPKHGGVSDRLLSDLIRAHRDANGKRTAPVGLASALQMLHELQVPLSSLGTYCYVSLLTCCKNPWEGGKLNDLRREHGVASNGYFWSALVDVHARSGDYRGAEGVLDEMLEETRREHGEWMARAERESGGDGLTMRRMEKEREPIAIPPLAAYTSFFSACHKLISRTDVHPSIKSDAADRAWSRWKEMRIHSVPPDVMAYGALMRIFAAQGRPEQAIDLLDEIMMQMMRPVSGSTVLNGRGGADEVLTSGDGDDDGWYDDRDGRTVRVKPTTLLFTSALKAVAKSHEVATIFNGGASRKNRRRESIASYHSRLARRIVVLAEQAEVRQDDGFVSALMLCAAAAGDSSTARAIYLASKVRRLDHLRTCGGSDHLNRLQGLIPEGERRALLGDGSTAPALSGTNGNKPALRTIEEEFAEEHAAYEAREYGTDTRILSTLLLAHSKAMEARGLGSMWAGRYNRGYLCPNSVRYMEAYNLPQMENMAIPNLNSVEAGLSPEGWQAEDFDDPSGKTSKALRKKHKFRVQQIMGDGYGNRKDDQDSFFDGFDPDDDQDWRLQLRRELNGIDGQDGQLQLGGGGEEPEVTRDWLSERLFDKKERNIMAGFNEEDGTVSTMTYRVKDGATKVDGESDELYGNDFDSDSDDDDDVDSDSEDEMDDSVEDTPLRPATTDRDVLVKAMAEVTDDVDLADDLIPKGLGLDGNDDDEDMDYFDEDAFAKLLEDTERGIDDSRGGDAEELSSIPGVSTNDFYAFKAHLEAEARAEGLSQGVEEGEARQLFDMMRTYYDEGTMQAAQNSKLLGNDDSFESDEALMEGTGSSFSYAPVDTVARTFNAPAQTQNDGPTPQMQKAAASMGMSHQTMYADDYIQWASSQAGLAAEASSIMTASSSEKEVSQTEATPLDIPLPKQYNISPLDEDAEDPHIIELQQTLPGMPMNRIEKISDEFARVLGYPSILRLTLAVRENMPEAFSPQCLARVNLTNARHVMVSKKASVCFPALAHRNKR